MPSPRNIAVANGFVREFEAPPPIRQKFARRRSQPSPSAAKDRARRRKNPALRKFLQGRTGADSLKDLRREKICVQKAGRGRQV